MRGNEGSRPQPDDTLFFVDECLPAQVGQALRLVGYPITTSADEETRAVLDEDLIPWLAERRYIWITKDDAAKREHMVAIARHAISVVWVRGLEHGKDSVQKNKITARQLHLMLTVKLLEIEKLVRAARGPRYFTLHLAGDRVVLRPVTLAEVSDRVGRQRGARS
ncbi:MAG: hypothetical protein HYX51_03175 [Chloroflexi bacterium]|nr:hypothetical protein [Chloroflexota bacterium]